MATEIKGIAVYSVKEACDRVGISRDSLYRYEEEIGPFARNDKGDRVLTDTDIARLMSLKQEKRAKKISRRK